MNIYIALEENYRAREQKQNHRERAWHINEIVEQGHRDDKGTTWKQNFRARAWQHNHIARA